MTLLLGAEPLSAQRFATAVNQAEQIELDNSARISIERSRELVEQVASIGQPVYGLNTLLGSGRNTEVSAQKLLAYQLQVIRYHASGIGPYLSRRQARAVLLSRLVGFSRGGSGVHPETAELYRQLLNRNVYPAIPSRGSVGSSDLVQLAAVASVAIAEGEAFDAAGELISGAQALAAAGLEPVVLRPLEGLALISANSYSLGVAALILAELRRLAASADAALALSLEVIGRYDNGGSLEPFSASIAAAKSFSGLAESSELVRQLLRGSPLEDASRRASVQDALSFRSAPQTHGAFRTQLQHLEETLNIEFAGRADNPLVDLDSGTLISGGNFQIVNLALNLESLKIALAHLGIISERRIAKLYPAQRTIRQEKLAAADSDPGTEELPGLLWYSAASLLAELKVLAQPATLGAPTLSADIEDHSTLAPLALQQLERAVEVLQKLLTIEVLSASYLLTQPKTTAGPSPQISSRTRNSLGAGSQSLVDRIEPILASGYSAAALVSKAHQKLFGGEG
ncbi:aromatic amino acid ammonia-lyase [Psychromicrobium lacuslunae]|uniref:Phenylalanine ammonia-lyase n=1 Tax=Psychromicrobium lacuslunae TaxID=1618207 RepID=A0A0D4C253_9MICC|nr:aromatic amino acid ammonia-lyase [Psychromicrobium lacuslunae]AJT42609.1 phenylalanine ammonia-lyase [Psychromicrobium lacuslunae]